MYKLLLCLRYLRTRYIALASIISVTLGVATMIVVNAVMAGFSHEMQKRIHGILSDLVVQSRSLEGFPDPQRHMDYIRRVAGDDVVGMTATIHVPAMLSYQIQGQWITRQINLVGIDESTYAHVSDFARYLTHPENRHKLSFLLRESGYDVRNHERGSDAPYRADLEWAGWKWRRLLYGHPPDAASRQPGTAGERPAAIDERPGFPVQTPVAGDREPGFAAQAPAAASRQPEENPATDRLPAVSSDDGAHPLSARHSDPSADEPWPDVLPPGGDPFASRPWDPEGEENLFDPATQQHTGVMLGIALADYRYRDEEGNVVERFLVRPGDDVKLTFPTAGTPPKAVTDTVTIVDFYESKMSEYDSTFVFMPLKRLQQLRGMIEPATGTTFVTAIQIKLRDGASGEQVRDKLLSATLGGMPLFPPELYQVQTWRDKQGPLLQAVELETAVLNILLFLIIAVAGFGILATFFMIVVEKTKDIGILKSLGASATGVMGIFVSYGLSLGTVGAGAGMVLGLLLVKYINEIRNLLERLSGREVFDPTIYYFHEIPTIVNPLTVGWIVAGAVLIAVLASVLPALRAALLHPVDALRA